MKKLLNIIILLIVLQWITFSANIFFQPTSWELLQNCQNEIQIWIDTEWEQTNTIDIKIINNQNLPIININPSNWEFENYIQKTNSLIRQWPYKWQTATYIMWNSNKQIQWKKLFATIYTIPKKLWTEKLVFYMIPNYNGDDSNINKINNGKIIDILNQSKDGNYKIIKWECPQTSKMRTGTKIQSKSIKTKNIKLLQLNPEIKNAISKTTDKPIKTKQTINIKQYNTKIKITPWIKAKQLFIKIIKKIIIHY